MSEPDLLAILRTFVEAHEQPHPSTGKREPIYYLRHIGGSTLDHHALPEQRPHFDEAIIDEMYGAGLLSLDFLEHGYKSRPQPKDGPSSRKSIELRTLTLWPTSNQSWRP